MWIKLGILLTGFAYAGLLPYFIQKAAKHVHLDMNVQTLSFLSNKKLYGEKYKKAYKHLLFITAILNYFFFWLLSEFYYLGAYEQYWRYVDYSFAFLTLLAFVPHNINPYSFKHLKESVQRFIHNFLAGLVFLVIPALIIQFQLVVLHEMYVQGVIGIFIVSITILLTIWSIIANGLNGVSEMIFIIGVSVWSIFTTVITMLR
jgi:hypothetical protein